MRLQGENRIRRLIYAALLAAMSILLGKYLAVNVTQSLRFSFENLPILAGAVLLGPVWGMAIGVTADLVGCMIVGYAINPFVTASVALIGLTAGLLYWLLCRVHATWRLALSVYGAHLLGSILAKTAALSYAFGTPFLVLLGTRTLIYAVTATLEFLLLFLILRNSAVKNALKGL